MAGTSPRVREVEAGERKQADVLLPPGTRVGDYEICAAIDRGGMATVYSAVHPLIGKEVAVKVLGAAFSAETGVVSRFVQEARAVNRIRHVNIVDIFSFGELPDGRSYCVMELLAGESLERRLRAVPGPTYEELFSILCQIADALEAAHEAGVVHRDVKPENVFLVRGDDGPVVKLLDFGIAKVITPGDRPGHETGGGVLVGTPAYMSPEQCAARAVDARTDVYALGVVMYEVFSGRLPFTSETPFEIVSGHLGEPPPEPLAIETFSPALADLVMACLAKDPAARPQRAAEVHDQLLEIARDPALDLAVHVPAPNPAAALAPRLSSGARARAASLPGQTRGRWTLLSGRVGALGGRAVVGALAVVGLVLLVARFATGDAPRAAAAAAKPAPIELALPFTVVDLGAVPVAVVAPAPGPEAAPDPEPASDRERENEPRATAVSARSSSSVRAAGKSATIDFLTYDPAGATVGEAITVTGTVTFDDPDGDVVALGSQVRPPTGERARANPKIRMTLKGAQRGTAAFTFVLRPTAPGPHSFDVWVVDAGRNMSNVLTGQIDVSEPTPSEPPPAP
ncbi:MAG TPA: serine/threonine-protein kinase [Kofleriaceae bacterium]|nr:serine/threonine-protein kinase [Kofleriaceae bacterium]